MTDAMTADDLDRAFALVLATPSVDQLTDRFNHAFRMTRDVHAGLAAVNEVSPHPMCYRELLGKLREGEGAAG